MIAREREALSCVRALDLLWRTQPIADAGFGHDVLRPLGVRLDLVAQLAHVHAQVLGICQIVPKLAQQDLVGEQFTGVLNQ